MTQSTDWLVLHTKAGKEGFAAGNLKNQGIEFFLPYTQVWRSNGRGRKQVEKAFFPRYLFARVESEARLSAVRYTRGVSGIVRAGDDPLWVPHSDIARIQEQRRSDGFFYAEDREVNPEFGFAVDQIVRIIDCYSVWNGRLGKYKGPAKGDGEILIEIEMPNFAKSVAVPMAAALVVPA